MKALLAASLVVGASLMGGCATPQYTAEDLDGRVVCDQRVMAAVEHEAHRNAADVRWINCPTATIRVVRS